MQNLIGQQIENYRIDALLGEGGMGAVYKAFDVNLARPVALKVMHAHLASQPEFQRRFLQEAQAAARLDHPSIVKIHTFGGRQGLFYMVMEFVAGASLAGYIRQLQQSGQVIKLSETLLILAQVADALGYAHRRGVVHRDVKPDNALLKPIEEADQGGGLPVRAVVTDFGLAKLLEGGMQTQTGTFMGTLPYMSPEQCLNKELDGRSDLYSLGIMLYQLTTGQLPFDIKSPTDAVLKHLNEPPPEPQNIRPGLPAGVAGIIKKAIAKNPAERQQSGEELAAALRQAAAGLTDADVTLFAPAQSVVSLATQLLPAGGGVAQPSRLGMDLTALPGQERLLIARAGEAPRSVTLGKNVLTIGRSGENDIVLAVEGVSRQHARLERSSSGGWQVVDLGSTNGTYLEESRLLPDLPEVWQAGQALRVGPYFLRWQQAEGPVAGGGVLPTRQGVYGGPSIGATARANVPLGGTQVYSGSGQLSVVVQPTNIEVAPGSRADVQVELLNQGMTVDHFSLNVEGLPAGWVTVPGQPVQLMPGANGALPLAIHPPPESQSTAGAHRYRLVVSSTSNAQESASVSGTVTVRPFERFAIDMRPMRLRNGGTCRVLIRNEGNSETTYSVVGRDPAEAIAFEQQRGRLKLGPGERGTVDLNLAAKERPFIGGGKTLPFEVQVGTAAGERQSLTGQLDVRPVLPGWLIPLLGILLLVLCLAGGGLLAFFNSRNQQATQTAQALAAGQSAATQTVVAQQTAEALLTAQAAGQAAGTATALAQTAEAAGDDDGDGLSNTQEITLGTNPDNLDTDGDGLNDGQEVNQYGTNPKQQDSDGDTLLDGAEVNEHGTSPTNPDTDGDGSPDGVEVAAGTNPLQPPTATPPPTATSPPTNAPTATPTPPPTATPTNVPTATPTLTPTPGYALRFDGTDDFVSVADSGDFDFNTAFTVEAWIYPTSLVSSGDFAAIVQGANSEPPFSGGAWVLLLDNADHSDWGLSVCVPSCNSAGSGVGNLQTNQWQHIAGVYDGSQIAIFRNGQFIASQPHSGDVSDVNFVLIGIWIETFRGQIDEVRLWNVARSQTEIQNDMNRLLNGNEFGLVGYWRFDEGSGQAALDSTSNGNNGKLGSTPGNDGNDPAWIVSDAPIN
ncbi:MAG: protein kinase [Chloroflexi bacterium]|nr:protein kinase [Chloroflexota bacterium]